MNGSKEWIHGYMDRWVGEWGPYPILPLLQGWATIQSRSSSESVVSSSIHGPLFCPYEAPEPRMSIETMARPFARKRYGERVGKENLSIIT